MSMVGDVEIKEWLRHLPTWVENRDGLGFQCSPDVSWVGFGTFLSSKATMFG
jgi:hypothetical protein